MYEILEKIGEGSFGKVFIGTHMRSGKRIILKTEISSYGLLKHETNILYYLSRNHCSNVPLVHWYGNTDIFSTPCKCLVMTYFPGKSLHQLREIMTWENKKEWVCSIIKILEQIHRTGVIHRDIKPAHFIYSGEWNLIDFGLATFYSETRESTEITGSPNYVSIYVHRGGRASRRDDLISLGYVFLELCSALPWKTQMNVEKKEWAYLYSFISEIPERDVLLRYFKECESWSFEQTPSYEKLRITCI